METAIVKEGYTKSAITRKKILYAALEIFGNKGFAASGTREIATLAKVNQPAINYHFKGKEQLYLACADFIIDRFQTQTVASDLDMEAFFAQGSSPAQGRDMLKTIITGLAAFYLKPSSRHWVSFVHREVRNQGVAYDRLYTHVWSPGIRLVTALIDVIRGTADPHNRLEAMMLISSLITFQSGILVAKQAMKWDKIGDTEFASIKAMIEKRIDEMG